MKRKFRFLLSCILVVSIAINNATIVSAAYCEHTFLNHRENVAGYIEREKKCRYMSDENMDPLSYKEDCVTYDLYIYCDYVCSKCNATMEGGLHDHSKGRFHTVYHEECMGLCN